MGRKPEALPPPFSDPKKLLLPHEFSRREVLRIFSLSFLASLTGGLLGRVFENTCSPPFSDEEILAWLKDQRETSSRLKFGLYPHIQREYPGDPNLKRGYELMNLTRELAEEPICVGIFSTFNRLINPKERRDFTLLVEQIYLAGNIPIVSLGFDPLIPGEHPFTANIGRIREMLWDVARYLVSFDRPMLVRPFYEMNSPSGMGHGRNRNIDPHLHEELSIQFFRLFFNYVWTLDPRGLIEICWSVIPENNMAGYYPGHGFVHKVGADVYSMNSKDPRNPWFYAAGPRDILYTLPRLFESLLAIISSSPTEIPLYLFEVGALSGDPQVLLMMIAIAIHYGIAGVFPFAKVKTHLGVPHERDWSYGKDVAVAIMELLRQANNFRQ